MATAEIRFQLTPAQIRVALEAPGGPVVRDLTRRGQRVLNMARTLCPVDEGRLRGSLAMELVKLGSGWVVRIGTNMPYAIWVHEGTGVYAGRGYIYPKRAKVLRWPAKNNSGQGRRRYRKGSTARYAYARRVKGVKGRPFLADALKAGA